MLICNRSAISVARSSAISSASKDECTFDKYTPFWVANQQDSKSSLVLKGLCEHILSLQRMRSTAGRWKSPTMRAEMFAKSANALLSTTNSSYKVAKLFSHNRSRARKPGSTRYAMSRPSYLLGSPRSGLAAALCGAGSDSLVHALMTNAFLFASQTSRLPAACRRSR